MVFDTASLVEGAKSSVGGLGSILLYIGLGLVILLLIGVVGIIWYLKKRFNLVVIFKLTRSDGHFTDCEVGKGVYDAEKGVVFIKRPGGHWWQKGMPIKIFDIRKHLLGTNTLEVLQVGPEDFRPILNKSWEEVEVKYYDDETGKVITKKEPILNILVDGGLDKAWKTSWDAAAKKAYSIASFLQQFQVPIAVGIVVVCCFVGFAILWTKVH